VLLSSSNRFCSPVRWESNDGFERLTTSRLTEFIAQVANDRSPPDVSDAARAKSMDVTGKKGLAAVACCAVPERLLWQALRFGLSGSKGPGVAIQSLL
jgi:hypothetical protein